jgi:hypothetical protein
LTKLPQSDFFPDLIKTIQTLTQHLEQRSTLLATPTKINCFVAVLRPEDAQRLGFVGVRKHNMMREPNACLFVFGFRRRFLAL